MISSGTQLLRKIHPPLISVLVKPLAPVCILFTCHLAVGMIEDLVIWGVKEEGSNLCLPPLLTILIQVINGSVLRHIHSCKSMSALPLTGLQYPKQGARSWEIGWNKWWALWVFPLFFCILCRCAPGYFGNPQKFGGSCQPCSCNNNGHLGSCDPLTGGKIDSHLC